MRPRRVAGVTRREVGGGECVLLSADAARAVVLNPLGAVVWDLCDGARSEREISGVIAGRFADEPASRIEGDVRALVAELGRAGLVEDADACGSGASGP